MARNTIPAWETPPAARDFTQRNVSVICGASVDTTERFG